MWKEESSTLSWVQEPGCRPWWYLLPFFVINVTRRVEQFAFEFLSYGKRVSVEVNNQLQAAGFRKWPLNFQARSTQDFKLRLPRGNVFDSGNNLFASSLQYISIKLQPLGMRFLSYCIPAKLGSQKCFLRIRIRNLRLR